PGASMREAGASPMRASSRSLASNFATRPTAKASPHCSRPFPAELKPGSFAIVGWFTLAARFAFIALTSIGAYTVHAAQGEKDAPAPCIEDAMIAFDASGSTATAGATEARPLAR